MFDFLQIFFGNFLSESCLSRGQQMGHQPKGMMGCGLSVVMGCRDSNQIWPYPVVFFAWFTRLSVCLSLSSRDLLTSFFLSLLHLDLNYGEFLLACLTLPRRCTVLYASTQCHCLCTSVLTNFKFADSEEKCKGWRECKYLTVGMVGFMW